MQKIGCVPESLNNKNCVPTDKKPVRKLTNFSQGVQKNTQTSAIIAALKSLVLKQRERESCFASSKFIRPVLPELHEILHQMTQIPSKEENTEAIMFLLCKINNNSTAAQTQGHIDI